MKINLEVGNIHIWEGSNRQVIVSHEDIKKLEAYKSIDAAVNSLYVNGFRDAALALNKLNR